MEPLDGLIRNKKTDINGKQRRYREEVEGLPLPIYPKSKINIRLGPVTTPRTLTHLFGAQKEMARSTSCYFPSLLPILPIHTYMYMRTHTHAHLNIHTSLRTCVMHTQRKQTGQMAADLSACWGGVGRRS